MLPDGRAMCYCCIAISCSSQRRPRKLPFWARCKVPRRTSIEQVCLETITSQRAVDRHRRRIERGYTSYAPMVMSFRGGERDGSGARDRATCGRAIRSSYRSTQRGWRRCLFGLRSPLLFTTWPSRFWRFIASRRNEQRLGIRPR